MEKYGFLERKLLVDFGEFKIFSGSEVWMFRGVKLLIFLCEKFLLVRGFHFENFNEEKNWIIWI